MVTKSQSTAVAAALIASLWAGGALAGSATLTLTRDSLNNVTDSAGVYQYETGAITTAAGTNAGFYTITRRVMSAGGVDMVLNAASETINLVFSTAATTSPYPNITVEGTFNFNSGAFGGSTSAASAIYKSAIGGDASATVVGIGVTSLVLGLKGHHTVP